MTGYRQQKPRFGLTKCPDLVDHYTLWLRNHWDSTPKKSPIATRFVYEAGLSACAVTSDAIYNNTLKKLESDLSKFHQWYLRDLQRLKV